VPKESRKFINPLLRPSTTAETPPASPKKEKAASRRTGTPSKPAQQEVVQDETPQITETQEEAVMQPIDEILAEEAGSSFAPEEQSRERKMLVREAAPSYAPEFPETHTEEAVEIPSVSDEALSHETTPVDASVDSQEEPVQEDEVRRKPGLRRKRGGQSFEKTHERITLWIDKGLKYAFDDLAHKLEIPKTTLLNEAISDLLKKYESR
jgi:hypothetical protein